MRRLDRGKYYWTIDVTLLNGEHEMEESPSPVYRVMERGDRFDDERWKTGNYFWTKKRAKAELDGSWRERRLRQQRASSARYYTRNRDRVLEKRAASKARRQNETFKNEEYGDKDQSGDRHEAADGVISGEALRESAREAGLAS